MDVAQENRSNLCEIFPGIFENRSAKDAKPEPRDKRSPGKWSSESGVPPTGWTCSCDVDLGSPDATVCEMCETQPIRYVHFMEHPSYPKVLGVGCVCAGKMEQDPEAARNREKVLKNTARRRSRWLKRTWRTSQNGNLYLNTDGFNIVCYQQGNRWGGRIQDRNDETMKWYVPCQHQTLDKAKFAAFDAMISLKRKKINPQAGHK